MELIVNVAIVPHSSRIKTLLSTNQNPRNQRRHQFSLVDFNKEIRSSKGILFEKGTSCINEKNLLATSFLL